MKTIFLFLVLVTALFGEETDKLQFTSGEVMRLESSYPLNLKIRAGDSAITINLRTGQVELPKGMTLPDAAVAFWLRVAQAFPECRQAIITGDPTPKNVDWMTGPTAAGKKAELGFRSDGVVVWREVPAK